MTTITCEKREFQVEAAIEWEWVPCNLCEHDETEAYYQERLPYFGEMLGFHIVRCRHCGLVYTNPRLTDHNAVYLCSDSDDTIQIEKHARAKADVFATALNEIESKLSCDTLGQARSGYRLLDIGSGSGHFLAAARERGFDVCGIEAAKASADFAVRNFGVPVLNKDLYQVELPVENYDVITAWDVIEHLPDPHEFLRRCVNWLKPGGIIALRFPSATWQKTKAVVLNQILSANHPIFGSTMHLYFFTEKTFKKLCEQVGLQIWRVKTTYAETNTNNPLLDSLKVLSNMVIRSLDAISGKHLGNLEVYCRKEK